VVAPLGVRRTATSTLRAARGDRERQVRPETPSGVSRSLPVAPRPLRYAAASAWALVVLYASAVEPTGGPPSALLAVATTVHLHFLAYAVLAALAGYALLAADRRALVAAAGAAALYGAGVELLQGRLPYRTMSGFDAAVNAAGAVVGGLLWRAVARRFAAPTTTRLSGSTD
jgi:VanZ family protein